MPTTELPDVSIDSIMRLVSIEAHDHSTTLTPETTTSISNFCLLWNLYEGIFFNKQYSNNKLLEVLASDDPAIRIKNISQPLNYFKARYIQTDGTLNYFYKGLDPHGRTKLDQRDRIEQGLRESYDGDNAEFTILAIVYRFRNNLFHGEKALETLNDQRANFVIANHVLLDVIQNHMSTNGL